MVNITGSIRVCGVWFINRWLRLMLEKVRCLRVFSILCCSLFVWFSKFRVDFLCFKIIKDDLLLLIVLLFGINIGKFICILILVV